VEIHIGSRNQWFAFLPFGSDVEYREEYKWKIVGCKCGCVPVVLQEYRPAAELMLQANVRVFHTTTGKNNIRRR